MNWEKERLEDCCISISDGDHMPPPKAKLGIPFITISNITSTNHIDFTNTMFVQKEYYDNVADKRKAKLGDILYTVVGSYGIPVLIKENMKFVFQRHIAILRPNEKLDSKFLYYSMLNKEFYMKADAVAVGAAQKTIGLASLRKLEIFCPSIEVQRRIANILSSYDDLIENSQKQIALLGEAAQRLFKEWFVDFHYPESEEKNVVDGVPENWRYGTLGEIAYDSGKRCKKEMVNKFKYYLPIDCIPKKSLAYLEYKSVNEAESSLISFENNDILFGAMRPYFHKVVVARDNGLTRSTCFVLNAVENDYWAFLLILLFSEDSINYATQISVGTTMPYVRWKDFCNMPVLIPDENCVKQFTKLTAPIIDKIKSLSEGIISLQQARQRLLPKLMSGELEV